MPDDPHEPRSPNLRGLDPGKLLSVLGPAPSPPPAVPGWRITGISGQGGFGTVWKAVRESDGAIAALKIAPGSDPDTVERLEQETAALAALRHPHIVPLLESGPLASADPDEDGGLFLAMGFVGGSTLADEIPPGGLEPKRAFALFFTIAAAVAHAHARGILHRDLKPSNILLDPAGKPMVADFGLARPVHQRVQHLSLTRAGLIAGTAEYLPPEAYHRAYAPHAGADIFALGVMLYEMLAGTPPRGAWVPVSERRSVDIRIDGLIRRALDPDPARRWKSVAEMSAGLAAILASPPRHAGTPLVTFPVRVADALWTGIGLLLLVSATSVHLHLSKAQVKWPLDLIGTHGNLTGGFQSLYFLLLAAVPSALWQLARLWRFRQVPLREALPAPLGLKLGHSRTAAALVAAAQLFCFLLPAAQLAYLHLRVNRVWLKADAPPWAYGLVVTPAWDTSVHPPWQRGKPGAFYWLRENQGPPDHPLSRTVDRIDFFPGTTPAVMAGAGGLLALTLLVTAGMAGLSWWRQARRGRVLLLLAAGGLLLDSAARLHAAERRRVAQERSLNPFVTGRLIHQLRQHAVALIDAPRPPGFPTAADLALYDVTLNHYRGRQHVPREEIPPLLAKEDRIRSAFRRHTETLYADDKDSKWNPKDRRFSIFRHVAEMLDPLNPDEPAVTSSLALTLEGSLDLDGRIAIDHEAMIRQPLFTSAPAALSPDAAAAWAEDFVRACHAEASHPSLEDLLNSALLPAGNARPADPSAMAAARGHLIAALRARPPALAGPVEILGFHPGGRTRIALTLAGDGGPELRWQADLIHADDRWRCVRLAF